MRPLNWSETTITFNPNDQLRCSFMAGKLTVMCTPTISNVLVNKTLMNSGARLNVLSVETFETLELLYKQIMPTKPFSGGTDGSTMPIAQVRLPTTFGECKNYHTEIVVFDIAHIHLPYNAILGYPALAKFTSVTHHGYNVLKMPGSSASSPSPATRRMRFVHSSAPTAPRRRDARTTKKMSHLARTHTRRRNISSPWSALGLRPPCPGTGSCLPLHKKARSVPPLGQDWGLPPGMFPA
ncbi:hypothetical protein ZWY2020_041919 [Hordeum vulgare]|nr:hypothetical protein ZWY2020_041919 [Hordeum vulgare]